jgi:hypothetical protein
MPGEAVGDELDLMMLIGGAEEWAAIQWERSMWEFLYEHVVSKGSDERDSGDHGRFPQG